jgi:hypothetical protein
MGVPATDVEKQQPLLPVAEGEKVPSSSGDTCGCDAFPRASPTATRTLTLVVLVAGAAFAAQLVAPEEYVLLAVFASQLQVQRSRRAFWSYTAQIHGEEVLKVRTVSK